MLRISEVAQRFGVTVNTVRRWVHEGRITSERTKGNHRVFREEDIFPKEKRSKQVILYGRVSSAKQRNDLQRQQQYLQERIPPEFKGHDIIPVHDVASGLNFKRPGLLHLLGLVQEGNVSAVIVASRDRLCRFGFELVEWLCQQHGAQVVVLHHEDTTPETELGEDLLSIVQVYCCRWNGRRRYRHNEGSSESSKTTVTPNPRTEEASS